MIPPIQNRIPNTPSRSEDIIFRLLNLYYIFVQKKKYFIFPFFLKSNICIHIYTYRNQASIPIRAKAKKRISSVDTGALFKWNVGTKLIVQGRFPFRYGNLDRVYCRIPHSACQTLKMFDSYLCSGICERFISLLETHSIFLYIIYLIVLL